MTAVAATGGLIAALCLGAWATAAAAAQAGNGAGSPAAERPAAAGTVTVAITPSGTKLSQLERIADASIGLLSPGIGFVPSFQTYLDITQGNRMSQTLYDPVELPGLRLQLTLPERVPPGVWRLIQRRAERAPAAVVPGLLASSLERAGLAATAERAAENAALIAVDRGGEIQQRRDGEPAPAGMVVTARSPAELSRLAAGLRGNDLLIAIERPPARVRLLTVAIAGRGFSDGRLISASTRTRGLVTAASALRRRMR